MNTSVVVHQIYWVKLGCPISRIGSATRGDPANNNMADSFPSIGSPQRVGTSRNKVALKPGRSLMDWIRLGNSGKDLQGFGGKFHKVSEEELAQHNTIDDVWICLRGRIYNS